MQPSFCVLRKFSEVLWTLVMKSCVVKKVSNRFTHMAQLPILQWCSRLFHSSSTDSSAIGLARWELWIMNILCHLGERPLPDGITSVGNAIWRAWALGQCLTHSATDTTPRSALGQCKLFYSFSASPTSSSNAFDYPFSLSFPGCTVPTMLPHLHVLNAFPNHSFLKCNFSWP